MTTKHESRSLRNSDLTFGLPRGWYPPPLRFFRCHTFCFWYKILTFQVAVGGPFAHIFRGINVYDSPYHSRVKVYLPRIAGGGFPPPRLSALTYYSCNSRR